MTEAALATSILATPKPPTSLIWDDASTLASRSSWSSSRSAETLASLGWKSRPRQSDCRELLSSNRFMVKPTPAIFVHGTRCSCTPEDPKISSARSDDDILADQIAAASDPYRSHRKRTKQRKRQSASLITRIFASTVTSPGATNNHKVPDLCFGCSALDIGKVTRYLIDENIPVNSTNHVGTTPLMAAVRAVNPQLRPRSHLAMIAFLLDCGADPNAAGSAVNPPGHGTMSILSAAVSLNLTDVLRMLLNHGAAVDAPLTTIPMFRFGGHGLTALHVAAFADKPKPMEILLEHGGANVSATFDGCRAIEWLDHVPKHKRDKKLWTTGITALHIADDSPACTALLLRYGADPNARDNYRRTPLHWAMTSGNVEVVRLLLEAGTNPDVVDDDGATPLSELVTRLECGASRQGHPEIARMLLEWGADPDLEYPQNVSLRDRLFKMDNWRGVYEPIFQHAAGEVFEKEVHIC
ncbi:ankyrin [Rhypophila sp. PSN 637]